MQNIPDIPVVVPIGRPPMYICIILGWDAIIMDRLTLLVQLPRAPGRQLLHGLPPRAHTQLRHVPVMHLQNFVNPFPALDDICRPADRDFSKICCAHCVGAMPTL